MANNLCTKCEKTIGLMGNYGDDANPLCYNCSLTLKKCTSCKSTFRSENEKESPIVKYNNALPYCEQCFAEIPQKHTVNFSKKETGNSGFWSFGTMITLKIIPAAFIIALFANAIAAFTWSKGIYRIVYSISSGDTAELFGWLAAIAVFIVSNLLLGIITRVFFEMLIVVFKIWENTKIIADKSDGK